MQVFVFLKALLDPAQPLRPSANPPGLRPEGEALYAPGPAGLAALEFALRLASERQALVTAVSAGGEEARQALDAGLARGAHHAVWLQAAPEGLAGDWLATAAAGWPGLQSADLVLCGDSPSGAFAAGLAEGLRRPLVTRCLSVDVAGDALLAERGLERGSRQRLQLSLPAVAAVLPQAAQPRYLSVLRLAEAARQPVEAVPLPVQPALSGLRLVEITPARPRPRRMAAPSASLSAAGRMAFLMGGGQSRAAASGGDRIFEGSPEQAVERIVQYLKENGLL